MSWCLFDVDWFHPEKKKRSQKNKRTKKGDKCFGVYLMWIGSTQKRKKDPKRTKEKKHQN